MKITFYLQSECNDVFRQMAKEAGIKVSDMAEIACYNLIALYTKQHAVVDVDGNQTMPTNKSLPADNVPVGDVDLDSVSVEPLSKAS